MQTHVTAAIILAAGASTRMGHPKALTPIRGVPALTLVARTARSAGADPVIVVLGADMEKTFFAVPADAQAVRFADWRRGRTASLKAGIRGLLEPCPILVWPVDHPLVTASTLKRLLAAQGEIRVPVHEGKRGHPTVFATDAARGILALRDDEPLHNLLHADPRRVVEVHVQDEGVLLNLDTRADLPT